MAVKQGVPWSELLPWPRAPSGTQDLGQSFSQ